MHIKKLEILKLIWRFMCLLDCCQSLKYKDSKHDNQPLILLNWLFQDEFLFEAVAINLANIITRKDDRYIAFGWCTLVRGLMEYENVMDQYLFNGTRMDSLFYFYLRCLYGADNVSMYVKLLC